MTNSNVRSMNYQQMLDKELAEITKNGTTKSLLLHACCAPCSSYVLEYLAQYFEITVFFYNPNITGAEEYAHRVAEIQRLISEQPHLHRVQFLEGKYDPAVFYEMSKGLEDVPEGGERCFKCYELRLRESAEAAKKGGFDYFTTTLSISPLKNSKKLNEIGGRLSEEYGIPYLFSDFKKKGGYLRSIELSAQYSLYRQNFCGCEFSKRQAEERDRRKAEESRKQE